MTVCDVVFNPPETKFLKEAKARGAATVNGLGMLVNQAALNYCLWTENMAPKDMMKEALLREFNLEKYSDTGKGNKRYSKKYENRYNRYSQYNGKY